MLTLTIRAARTSPVSSENPDKPPTSRARRRWIATVPELAGCHAYGPTREVSVQLAKAGALRAIAAMIERGEQLPGPAQADNITFVVV
jgi:predicted RNase H-like HicB family nuclease